MIYKNINYILKYIFVFSFLVLISTLNIVIAKGEYTKVSTSTYEISYDPLPNLFVYPLEHSMDRIVNIKNISQNDITLSFERNMKINGKDSEIQTWPQPTPSRLLPGDQIDFVMKIEWFSDLTNTWEQGKTYDYPFYINISINNIPVNEIILYNQILVEKTQDHLQEISTNAKISGIVYDSETNKPLNDTEVIVWSNGPRVEYKVRTDSLGSFSIPVRAYQRSFLKNYIQYSVTIRKDGYDEFNYALSPKENEDLSKEIKLSKQTERGSYTLINKIYTNLPPARVDFSGDHKFFATVPFHSSESEDFINENAYLHFFSSDGNLLWKYKLENEIPTVDVSDDGTLIATAHRPKSNNWNGGDYLILFNQKGDLIWEFKIPGIGDWGDPNHVSEPGEVGDGISELRISYNNKYIVAGTWAGKFYFIDIDNNKVLWNTDLNNGQVRYILFKEDDTSVYVGSDPYMFNFDFNGKLNWKAFIGSWPYNMVLSNNYVFVGPKVGRFISLFNKNTGDVIWRYPIDARPDNLLISPDETFLMYQSSNGELAISNAVFDASGNLLFNLRSANGGYITSDSNYIAYYGGDSVRLVNRKGSELWSYQLDPIKWPAPRGSVYISDDKTKIIVANAMNGYVYFFEGGIEELGDNQESNNNDDRKLEPNNQNQEPDAQNNTIEQDNQNQEQKTESFLKRILIWISKIFH